MAISFKLRAFTQCKQFHFPFFLQFEFVLLLLCFVLFCFFFLLLIFQADTSLFLFHLIVENLILHILLIITIIIPCSGMFRNVPCSWFYRRRVYVKRGTHPQLAGTTRNHPESPGTTRNLAGTTRNLPGTPRNLDRIPK